jgi:iron complex outermembrane receptor protein
MRRSVVACATASVFVLSFATSALAQAVAAGPDTIDQIVVTAQKRTQSLQDVPIVVTAVSAQQLKDANVRDIKDLTILTPGLTVTSTSSEASTTARIRGVGTVGDNPGLESSVGVVIDGVYRPRNSVGFGDLGELTRIEVLKGPQGTLFGKNTTAGVINIISERPKFKFGADAEVTVSNYSGYGGSVSVTGPIMDDKLAGRLYLADRKRDGFYKIKTGAGPRTDHDDANQNFFSARAQLLFTPSSNFDINLVGDYTKRQEHCCAAVQLLEAGTSQNAMHILDPIDGGVAVTPDPYKRVAYSNRKTTQNIEDMGVSGEANWRTDWFGGATLTSITAARNWKRTGETDPDYSTVDILGYDTAHQNTEFKQFSEEVRLAGKTSKLDWLIGGFYANEDLIQNTALRYGSQFENYASLLFSGGASQTLISTIQGRPPGTSFVAGQGQLDHYKQNEYNLALFTNDTFHITDKLEATLGVRYTSEHKTLNTLYNNTDGGLGCATLETNRQQAGASTSSLQCGTFQNYLFNNLADHQGKTESAVTGTFKVDYRWSRELMTYASYARGYKAGGFNLDRTACPYTVGTALSNACIASIAASGHPLVANPQAGAGNQNSIQPLYDTSFKPEFVDSYEAGFKSTLVDRTLLFNATAFFQKYKDFQLNAFNGLVFAVASVPEVTSKGVDADFVWLPTHGLTFQGGVTYADTRYANTAANIAVLGPKCAAFPYGNTVPAGCSQLPGARLSLAPLWSMSLSASYEHDLFDNLVGRATITSKSVTAYNTGSDLNPVKQQDGFTLVNARLAIHPMNDQWSAELWSQNLFDKHYMQVAFDATAQSKGYNAFLGQPRTYGVTVRAKF